MRYSTIIGEAFYKIKLPDGVKDVVDIHFTASAHHLRVLPLAKTKSDRAFHLKRHRGHLLALMDYVYKFGDFSQASDDSLRDLDQQSSWDPSRCFSLPDPKMFHSMSADPGVLPGEPHPSDVYIDWDGWFCETSLRQAS